MAVPRLAKNNFNKDQLIFMTLYINNNTSGYYNAKAINHINIFPKILQPLLNNYKTCCLRNNNNQRRVFSQIITIKREIR